MKTTIAAAAGMLIMGLPLIGPAPAGAEEDFEKDFVDPRTFFELIIPAAKKDFEAYHGDMALGVADMNTPTYIGELLLQDAGACYLKFEPDRPACYYCFKSYADEAKTPGGSPCLSLFRKWAAGLRQSLGSGWTVKEGWERGSSIHLLSARRKSDKSVYLELTHTLGADSEDGNCMVDLRIEHLAKPRPRRKGRK